MADDTGSFWSELAACDGRLSSVLELVARRAVEAVGETSVLSVLSEDGLRLEPAAVDHPDDEIRRSMRELFASAPLTIGEGIAGMVAATREAVVLNDVDPDAMATMSSARLRPLLVHYPVRAFMIVPLLARGEVMGTLSVMRLTSTAPYSHEDRLVVEGLAEQAAHAVAEVRLPSMTLGAVEYEAIFRYSLDGVLLTTPDGRILAANPAACEMLQRSEAQICRLGRSGVVVEDDPHLAQLLARRAVSGRASAELLFRRGKGEVFVAAASSALFTTPDGEARSVISFRDVSIEVRLREQLERQRAELEDLVDHDPLTGLLSRRGFTAAAEGLLAFADREGAGLLLAFFDLDGLKAINDELGHFAGDDALRRMGEALTGAVREVDAAARLAGDEFVVLLYAASEEEAHLVIGRIAETLDDPASRGPRLTFSVGIAARASGSSETVDELLKVADQRMYQQKILHRVEAHRRAARDDRSA
jgi:diguanylate cyclase (GGDEF)-like protein/PAS domain S-box-containing protein